MPPWAPAAIILLATLAAYWPALSAGYIWDDADFLTQNPLIRAQDGLYRFWFTKEPRDYFPLTSSMFWLEWRLWGANPMPYHLGNILMHAAAAILLWRVLARLKAPGALLAGLIFAVHPVAVPSVAWITERKNTLPMVLMLLSMLAYLRYDERGRWKYYALSLVLFLAALLAKTSVVTMPLALLLCAFWLRGKISARDLWRTLPFFALSLALGLATVWFQHHQAQPDEIAQALPLATNIAAAGWIVWFYLGKLLMPVGLCMVYPRWEVNGGDWLSFLPLALLLGLVVALFVLRRRIGRGPVAALTYFLVTLAPVMGFIRMAFMQHSRVADHLQYTAMIGLIALVAGLGTTLAARWRFPPRLSIAATVALLGVLGASTWLRAEDFKDEPTLWRANLKVNDKAWVAWSNLSQVSRKAPSRRLEYCDKAINLDPGNAMVWSNRAQMNLAMGRYHECVEDCTRAFELRPKHAPAFVNRAAAWHALGKDDLAEKDSATAIHLKKGLAAAYSCHGAAMFGLGKIDQALEDFSQAIRLQSDLAEAYNNRAACYHALHQDDRAWADITACRSFGGTPSPSLVRSVSQGLGGAK